MLDELWCPQPDVTGMVLRQEESSQHVLSPAMFSLVKHDDSARICKNIDDGWWFLMFIHIVYVWTHHSAKLWFPFSLSPGGFIKPFVSLLILMFAHHLPSLMSCFLFEMGYCGIAPPNVARMNGNAATCSKPSKPRAISLQLQMGPPKTRTCWHQRALCHTFN